MEVAVYKIGPLKEDTVQKANGKWTNRGDDGTEHGEFDTKAEADAQRKAMFASGYKGESLDEKLNLDKEGKALKRAIKNIVVDNDDELREFVSAIVEEVISERPLEEAVKGDAIVKVPADGQYVFYGKIYSDSGLLADYSSEGFETDTEDYSEARKKLSKHIQDTTGESRFSIDGQFDKEVNYVEVRQKCSDCGTELTDSGTCPKCNIEIDRQPSDKEMKG